MADAANVQEMWQLIEQGADRVQALSQRRRTDADLYNRLKGYRAKREEEWCKAGYLREIDKFDYKFFNISPKEAALMDPNQRIFLETAWQAIEDAGCGESIRGSDTGVYIGHSSDFGRLYKSMIENIGLEHGELALAGNIHSIIASRLSYVLDLKGPSLSIDTACSSSLVAVHLAVQAIRNGQCAMALAGGVKINSMPEFSSVLRDIGIHSASDKARSFDNSSDGTSFGEGAGVVVLKSLQRALMDGDHIYAVIKGSAINQDGTSINLTAPNVLAQQDVIVKAWQDAQVDPETVTYIEAHGTGTSLGDPIEVQAISSAFRKFTDKRQFCAVGTIKTNIGHLDHAAGIAGLIKAALSVKHKRLPASLHFEYPNAQIDFTTSPLYVNDGLHEWSEDIRRCGVSSFGLSGTNCHVVLEQAPAELSSGHRENDKYRCLAISAKSEESLAALADLYRRYGMLPETDLDRFCYTAHAGRFHHANRIMLVFRTREELLGQLQWLGDNRLQSDIEQGIYSSVGSTTAREGSVSANVGSTVEQWRRTGDSSMLYMLAEQYVKGASIPWPSLYEYGAPRKASIPAYPFARSRAWFTDYTEKRPNEPRQVVETLDRRVFAIEISATDHWFMSEHIVNGEFMLPGAAMLHLVKEAYASSRLQGVEFGNVIFSAPFTLGMNESKEIQIIIKTDLLPHAFAVSSKSEDRWIVHAEGTIGLVEREDTANVPISLVLQGLQHSAFHASDISNKDVKTGGHWDNVDAIYTGKDEVCLRLRLPERYRHEEDQFFIHPALMDNAVHVAMFSGKDELYLPWMYKEIRVYRRMPAQFYSRIRKIGGNSQTITLDIDWLNDRGERIASISEYCMKKVKAREQDTISNELHQIVWSPVTDDAAAQSDKREGTSVMLRTSDNRQCDEIRNALAEQGQRVIELIIGEASSGSFGKDRYGIRLSHMEADLIGVIGELASVKIDRVIHATGLDHRPIDSGNLEERKSLHLFSLFYLIKALLHQKVKLPLDLLIVAAYANKVTGTERMIQPLHAALAGIGKSAAQEYPDLFCRFVDVDEATNGHTIAEAIGNGKPYYQLALRANARYRETLDKLVINHESERALPIVNGGVYLITGGLGELGLATARYLADKHSVRLLLLHRSPLPARGHWEACLQRDNREASIIQCILDLEAAGSIVECHHVDIADAHAIAEAYHRIKWTHKKINGIFHCAGVAGDGYLIRKSLRQFNEVLQPKIDGTILLHELTQEEELDFFISYSSVTALFAGAGQADYCAANMFLDSFSSSGSRAQKRTLAINWPAWKHMGMAHRYGIADDRGLMMDIVPERAFQLLDVLLQSEDVRQAVIGKYNESKLADGLDGVPIELADKPAGNPAARPLPQASFASRNVAAEEGLPSSRTGSAFITDKVEALWTNVLGESDWQYDDNFFDVGGNSISAITLLKQLQQAYPDTVTVTDVFTYPTINLMSGYIRSKLAPIEGDGDKEAIDRRGDAASADGELDDLLDQLLRGEINVEAAYRKL